MALRSLGSSLVAKSSPGGRLRDVTEARIQSPKIPGKGNIGTLSRAGIEEPLMRQVPPGSEKIVSSQPTVEGSTVATPNIVPAMSVNPAVAPTVPSGANGQALFQGGITAPGQSRVASNPLTFSPKAGNQGTSSAPSMNVQGVASPKLAGGVAPTSNKVGGGAILNPKEPNTQIKTAIGSTNLRSGATSPAAIPTPTPTPTRPTVPNPVPTPSLPFQNIMQQIFGTPKAETNILGNIGNNLRSQIGNIFNNLRSLLGGKK